MPPLQPVLSGATYVAMAQCFLEHATMECDHFMTVLAAIGIDTETHDRTTSDMSGIISIAACLVATENRLAAHLQPGRPE